jgi:MFS family permease
MAMYHIDKNIIYLGWVSFFTDFASSMVKTLLPLYVIYILHEGVDKLGIIIAVASFISYFFRILFGYLSDRFMLVKPFVVTGYFISALTQPMLALTQGYIGVALMRGLERMGKAVRSAPKDALISAYSETNKSGKTFGFHKTMDIAGELGGAICIFLMLTWFTFDKDSIKLIFFATLIPGLIATAIALFLVKDVPMSIKATDKKNRAVINKQDMRLLPLIIIYFAALFFILSEQFMIIKAKESGYAISMIPLFIIALTLTQTLSSYYSGVISDKIGNSKMLLIAFIFGVLSIIALWQEYIWLSFILLGLFTVISLNTIRAYISQNATSKGFVFGIFYGGVALTSSLGAIVVGELWKRFGFEKTMLFSLSGMLILSILLAFRVWKEVVNTEEIPTV